VLRGGGSLYLGRLRQGFFEESAAAGAARVGEAREAVSQTVPSLATFVGVRWHPPGWEGVDFFLGYQYEYWWRGGKNDQTTSAAALSVQGVSMRAEITFGARRRVKLPVYLTPEGRRSAWGRAGRPPRSRPAAAGTSRSAHRPPRPAP